MGRKCLQTQLTGPCVGKRWRVVQRHVLALAVLPKTEQVPQLENTFQREPRMETLWPIENQDELKQGPGCAFLILKA